MVRLSTNWFGRDGELRFVEAVLECGLVRRIFRFCAVLRRQICCLEMVNFRKVFEGFGIWLVQCVSVCPCQFGTDLKLFIN